MTHQPTPRQLAYGCLLGLAVLLSLLCRLSGQW
jgi:hypothetical protein